MMKSAEYLVRTFNAVDKKNEDEYLSALNTIFGRMVEWRKKSGKFDLRMFEKQVNVIKTVHKEFVTAKESESVVIDGDRLWRALYSVYIAPLREKLFRDEIAIRRAKNRLVEHFCAEDCCDGVQPQENCSMNIIDLFK